MPKNPVTKELMLKYSQRKKDIEKRLSDFSRDREDKDLYAELAFCMLTPQSKARKCWQAVEELKEKGLLLSDDVEGVRKILKTKVRFHNNKAKYIIKNKHLFLAGGKVDVKSTLSKFENAGDLRAWLIENVKGYGWKEASHFLRNIGYYDNIAILDRHILRNLEKYGIIYDVPKALSPKKYLEIEGKMRAFCEKHSIPMSHLDLLFWSEETGEIFK